MSRLENAVAAVETLVGGLRSEIQTLRDEDTGDLDQAGQNALADRLERLVSPVEENPPVATEEPEVEGETVPDPATDVVAEPETEVTDGE